MFNANTVLCRFHCSANTNLNKYVYDYNSTTPPGQEDDMVLTVQNLKFQGDVQERKRPRTSFKFKSLTANRKHRMFIKQVVDEIVNTEEDTSSELTSYYFDDYVKYILNADRSRPSSSKSSIFLQDLSDKYRESKSNIVDKKPAEEPKKIRKVTAKIKNTPHKDHKQKDENNTEVNNNNEDSMQDAKVAFQKTGKRKCLTISRAQSPETIQVIRVDVVCNYSSSSVMTDYEEEKKQSCTKLAEKDIEKIKFKTPHFADKYLLTNTIKSVDENLSCGSKVTLLCKTYKLSDRSKLSQKKHNKYLKDASSNMTVKKNVKC